MTSYPGVTGEQFELSAMSGLLDEIFCSKTGIVGKKENRAISKTNARFQNKTSPTVDIEERVTSNINLEGLRFENRATPRTHSEGVNFGQYEK